MIKLGFKNESNEEIFKSTLMDVRECYLGGVDIRKKREISFNDEEDDEDPVQEDDLDVLMQQIIDKVCTPEHKRCLQDNLQSRYFIQQFITMLWLVDGYML
jgi:hypothetical protein